MLVAISDDTARTFLVENLRSDGYDALAASGLGHARNRLTDNVDAVIIDLGPDATKLVEAIRDGSAVSDVWLPILAGSGSTDLFYPSRLLERSADDVIYEPWRQLEVRAGWRRCCAAQTPADGRGRCCAPARYASISPVGGHGSARPRSS